MGSMVAMAAALSSCTRCRPCSQSSQYTSDFYSGKGTVVKTVQEPVVQQPVVQQPCYQPCQPRRAVRRTVTIDPYERAAALEAATGIHMNETNAVNVGNSVNGVYRGGCYGGARVIRGGNYWYGGGCSHARIFSINNHRVY